MTSLVPIQIGWSILLGTRSCSSIRPNRSGRWSTHSIILDSAVRRGFEGIRIDLQTARLRVVIVVEQVRNLHSTRTRERFGRRARLSRGKSAESRLLVITNRILITKYIRCCGSRARLQGISTILLHVIVYGTDSPIHDDHLHLRDPRPLLQSLQLDQPGSLSLA